MAIPTGHQGSNAGSRWPFAASEMSFTLRDRKEAPVANVGGADTWLAAATFSDSERNLGHAPCGLWRGIGGTPPSTPVRFACPADWSILSSPRGWALATFHAGQRCGATNRHDFGAGPAPASSPKLPLAQPALDAFFGQMGQRGYPAGLKPITSGQGRQIERNLAVWFEMACSCDGLLQRPTSGSGGHEVQILLAAHAWAFATTVNGQVLWMSVWSSTVVTQPRPGEGGRGSTRGSRIRARFSGERQRSTRRNRRPQRPRAHHHRRVHGVRPRVTWGQTPVVRSHMVRWVFRGGGLLSLEPRRGRRTE